MKLTKTHKSSISEAKDTPGLLAYRMDYEIKSVTGALDYVGPKIDKKMWHQVMSFFRWTHKEFNSESQVRLYVNPKLGRWGAWAFPQEARTGMTASELSTQETPDKARERFAFWGSAPSDDWMYFGTAHHHCSASAFQSSVDESNEKNQDGLHLTVGKMGSGEHDLHARFYVGTHCFEPDMSLFWDIDDDLKARLPGPMHAELARFEMCANVEAPFPDAWRANVIEKKHAANPYGLIEGSVRSAGGSINDNDEYWNSLEDWPRGASNASTPKHHQPKAHSFIGDAIEEVLQLCDMNKIPQHDYEEALCFILNNQAATIIVGACADHGVTPEDLADVRFG